MRFSPFVLGTLLLAGCTLNTDYFGEYRGKNLLSNYDFDAVDASAAPKWALSTGLANITDYMTWEKIGDPTNPATDLARDGTANTPTTGPSGTPVYRLEIKNLIPNGDFDDPLVSPDATGLAAPVGTGWSSKLVSATTDTFNYGSTPFSGVSIDARSLGWADKGGGDQLRLDLHAAAIASSNTAWDVGSYRLRFDFVSVGQSSQELLIFLYNTVPVPEGVDGTADAGPFGTPGEWRISTGGDHQTVFSLSQGFRLATSSDRRVLSIGSKDGDFNSYSAVLDNVRMLPDDNQNLFTETNLPTLESGSLTLLPGTKAGMYTFTVYVMDDPTAGLSTDRSNRNRFQPPGITVRIKAQVKSGTPSATIFFPRPASGWTTWTPLTVSTGFDFVNSDAALGGQPALSIALCPAQVSTEAVDVGSLLVSAPTLTFNP